MPGSSLLSKWQPVTSVRIVSEPQHRRTERMIIAFDHVDKNAFSTLTSSLFQVPNYRGATHPTGPEAIHTDNAAVFARTSIASPAPDSHPSQNHCAAP